MIVNFMCGSCYHKEEELFYASEVCPNHIECPQCTGKSWPLVPLTSKTASRWGHRGQVEGVFDNGLGQKVYTSMDKERIMKERGIEPLHSFAQHMTEDWAEAKGKKLDAQDKAQEAYAANLIKFDGNEELAQIETYPAQECLDGTGHAAAWED